MWMEMEIWSDLIWSDKDDQIGVRRQSRLDNQVESRISQQEVVVILTSFIHVVYAFMFSKFLYDEDCVDYSFSALLTHFFMFRIYQDLYCMKYNNSLEFKLLFLSSFPELNINFP